MKNLTKSRCSLAGDEVDLEMKLKSEKIQIDGAEEKRTFDEYSSKIEYADSIALSDEKGPFTLRVGRGTDNKICFCKLREGVEESSSGFTKEDGGALLMFLFMLTGRVVKIPPPYSEPDPDFRFQGERPASN